MAELNQIEIQGIGVISCSSLSPSQIIEKIISNSYDPVNYVYHKFGSHSLACYPWHLSTKYYEADVHFIEIIDRDLIGEQFADSIQAVIIYLDNNDELSCQKFHSWKPFVDEYNPDIRLLVVETAKDDDSVFNRSACMKWCINHEFELIELQAEEESDDDEYENDFVESNGTKRIIQALSAHTWPLMEMHDTPQYKPSPKFESLIRNELQSSSSHDQLVGKSDTDNDETNYSTNQRIDSIFEEDKEIFEKLSENQDVEFEDLFGKFKDLKKKAETLSGDERRLYAEKITLAFWRSLGGPDDEIADLDD